MKKIAVGLACAAALSLSANAGAVLFDYTGQGGADPNKVIDVASWDWSQSSALALGGIPANPNQAFFFTLFTHASLANFTGSNGQAITGTGLNTDFQVTFVGGFGEKGQVVSSNTTEFFFDPANPLNFFEMYWNDSLTADNSTDDGSPGGVGFNTGTRIAWGEVVFAGGGFTRFGGTPPTSSTNLDLFGMDSWGGQQTVSGAGGSQLSVTIGKMNFDKDFFLGIPDDLYFVLSFNTNNNLPFTEVDPANRFWDGTKYLTFGPDFDIGVLNGWNGPDILFQVDATQSIRVVPEPGTMLLLGSGLLGIAGVARRKTKNV